MRTWAEVNQAKWRWGLAWTTMAAMDMEYLRTATRPEHEGTEATVPLMDPGLTRAQYARVLQQMYGAVRAWDDWAAVHAPVRFAEMVAGRRRSPLMEEDLACLGVDVPRAVEMAEAAWEPREARDEAEREAMFLGAMYVIEGSTLGGQYIAKHAEEVLGLEPGRGDAYFRGYGEQTGSMWKSFKAVLADVPETHTELVVQTAKGMFGFFAEQMADRHPESVRYA